MRRIKSKFNQDNPALKAFFIIPIDVSSRNRPSTQAKDARKKHQRRATSSAYPYSFDSFDRAFGKNIALRDSLTSTSHVADQMLANEEPHISQAAYDNPKQVRPFIMRRLRATLNAKNHQTVAGEVLSRAAHRGNAGLVNDLLTTFPKLGRDEGAIQHAISSAAGVGNRFITKMLLLAPANVGRHAYVAQNAFYGSIYSGSPSTVKLFLEPPYNLGDDRWARRQIKNLTDGRKNHPLAHVLKEFDEAKKANEQKTLVKKKSKVFKRKKPGPIVLSRRQGQKIKPRTTAIPAVLTQPPVQAQRPIPALRHAESLLRNTERVQNSFPVTVVRLMQKTFSSLSSNIKLPQHSSPFRV